MSGRQRPRHLVPTLPFAQHAREIFFPLFLVSFAPRFLAQNTKRRGAICFSSHAKPPSSRSREGGHFLSMHVVAHTCLRKGG
jgi:hypothetical protein